MSIPAAALGSLPPGLREPLISYYRGICRNYVERRWSPAELEGGKLAEVVYTVIDGRLTGTYAASPRKPENFARACRALEAAPANSSRPDDHSLRVLIPRVLVALYDIRNNRSVGHVGGDVNPNEADATIVQSMSSWLLAELVRIFHGLSPDEAQDAVDALVERRVPLIWEVEGKKRVLNPAIEARDAALLLLYSEPGWVPVANLQTWVEYGDASKFRERILVPLHRERLIEYERTSSQAHISPLGSNDVETRLLPLLRLVWAE